jgi:hypothetical protein
MSKNPFASNTHSCDLYDNWPPEWKKKTAR